MAYGMIRAAFVAVAGVLKNELDRKKIERKRRKRVKVKYWIEKRKKLSSSDITYCQY